MNDEPLNLILYGPPGTGKTYGAIARAVHILDPDCPQGNRRIVRKRFEELRNRRRIAMATFHQSFSYEDFVEGLRADADDDGNISYQVEDGLFKRFCRGGSDLIDDESPDQEEEGSDGEINVLNRKIWKLSLGDSRDPAQEFVYGRCIAHNEIRFGTDPGVDYSDCPDKRSIETKFRREHDRGFSRVGTARKMHFFVNEMKEGDLVVIPDGNFKFRAIGEVMGGYEFRPLKYPTAEFVSLGKPPAKGASDQGSVPPDSRPDYAHVRPVRWHRVLEYSMPWHELTERSFTQQSLYELRKVTLKPDKLEAFLERTVAQKPNRPDDGEEPEEEPRVLIIDEINRGNIANIFGELITLIEPDKRAGQPEALEVQLPYSKEPFSVPDNIYIIGTMNTADKSLALLDTALRRRFHFKEVLPDASLLKTTANRVNLAKLLTAINKRIELLYDRDHLLGHSYFMGLDGNSSIEDLRRVFENAVLPLLEEHFFEDWGKIGQVLGHDRRTPEELQFIVPSFAEGEVKKLLGDDSSGELADKCYRRNPDALGNPAAYIGIYEASAGDGSTAGNA